jgi:hypothetical protein
VTLHPYWERLGALKTLRESVSVAHPQGNSGISWSGGSDSGAECNDWCSESDDQVEENVGVEEGKVMRLLCVVLVCCRVVWFPML